MKKLLAGLLVGVLLGSMASTFILCAFNIPGLNPGYRSGTADGAIYVWKELDKHFSKKNEQNSNRRLVECIGIKSQDISVVERDGVLTIETQ